MKTLAVLSQKGGTGKTTVAAHLAVAAEAAGCRTILMDMDPQRSATAWSRMREGPGPVISDAKAGTLFIARQAAEKLRMGLMVIDTPPSCGDETLEAARHADLCLIVVRPSFFDIEAARSTVEAVKALGRPAMFLLNQTPAGQPGAVKGAVEALGRYGLPVSPVRLHSRPAYQAAIGKGRTVQELGASSVAAVESDALWRLVEGNLDLSAMVAAEGQPILRVVSA